MRRSISAGALVVGLLLVAPGAVSGGTAPMALVYERTWGNAGATAIAVGPGGSVYVVGPTVVGEYPVQDLDATLVRWGPDGDLVWARSWRGSADERPEGVAIDAAGAAYVTGSSTSFGGMDAFLIKFDASGTLEWQRTWGGPREDGGEGVVVGADGGVYVAGFTQNFGTFPGAITFLAKFAPDGSLVWERTWETADGGLPRDIAAAPDGSIYVGGIAYPRGFVAKFSPDGTLLWDRTYHAQAPTGFTDFEGIAVAPNGGVLAIGSWMPTFDQELLVVQLTASGGLGFARSWGGDSIDVGVDAVVAADGTAFVVGATDTFSSGVYDDFFVLRMTPSGRATEVRTWGGPLQDAPSGAVLGADGAVFIAGAVGPPPYAFGDAPSQAYRVRRAMFADPAALVSIPGATLGIPDGVASAFDVGPASAVGGSALLRISPG